MGCDIHLHVEIKIDGEWLHYNIPDIERDYQLFTKMAGVRQSDYTIEPLSEPRGLPKNSSKITKLDAARWGIDGHSHSWLSYEEISELQKWYVKNSNKDLFSFHNKFGYLFGNGWKIEYRNENPDFLEDARFVFWFDN